MANTNGVNYANFVAVPPVRTSVQQWGGRVRCLREAWTLATQPAADTLTGPMLDVNMLLLAFMGISTVTLGAATLAGGVALAAAQFWAAQTFTAVNTPTFLAAAANILGALPTLPTATPDAAPLIITTAAASLPAAGTFQLLTFYVKD